MSVNTILFHQLLILLFGLFLIYLGFFNHVDQYEIGIARNWISGETRLQHSGFHLTNPAWQVACIDTRPMRVSVVSAGHGYSAKLVQFDATQWQSFVAVEGFRYYWWANRFSINMGYSEEYRGMRDIMRGHAYSTNQYPFLKIIGEMTK